MKAHLVFSALVLLFVAEKTIAQTGRQQPKNSSALRRETCSRLTPLLSSDDPSVRLIAAFALSERIRRIDPTYDTEEEIVISVLIEGMNHRDGLIRERSARSLRNLSSRSARSVPVLLKLMTDPDPAVQKTATRSLANYGNHSEQIVPALRDLQDNPNPQVRQLAVELLGNSHFGLRGQAVPDLMRSLADCDPRVRETTAHSLLEIGVEAKPALRALARIAYHDPDVSVRQMVIHAMASIGKEGVPDLIEILGESDIRLHEAALIGLGKHGAQSPEAVNALARVVRDEKSSYDLRYLAVHLLQQIGPPATAAIPAIESLLDFPAFPMRNKAEGALHAIRGSKAEADEPE